MIDPAVIEALVAAGATAEMIAAAHRADHAIDARKAAERRAKDAERQRRHRSRSVTVTLRDRHAMSRGVTPRPRDNPTPDKEKSPTPPKEINPTLESSLRSDSSHAEASKTKTPREILLESLTPEIADAVLAHRRSLRKPLTDRAAQLLAKGFTATGDPNAAADMMIARGWQGFNPEWFDNERAGNGQRKVGKRTLGDAGRDLIRRVDEAFAERERVRPSDGDPPSREAFRLLPGLGGQRS